MSRFCRDLWDLISGREEAIDDGQIEIDMALWKVSNILARNGETMRDICLEMETADSKVELIYTFKRFNKLMSFFHRAAPSRERYSLVLGALSVLGLSKEFELELKATVSLRDAIYNYKVKILHKLREIIRWREIELKEEDKLDEELFSRYFPVSAGEVEKAKRSVREFSEIQRSSKRRKVSNKSSENMLSKSDMVNITGKGLCIFYQFDQCKRGSKCQFRHEKNNTNNKT